MSILSRLQPGMHLYDRHTGRERILHQVERQGKVAFLSFRNPQTGAIDRQPFPTDEVEQRFELPLGGTVAFSGNPETVRLVAEAYRLQHAYLFNPAFATETSLIDLLPHQLAAVYGVPPTDEDPQGTPGMLEHARLRFLLADDAGAGKTIMAGLVIREMLLRRLVRRVLIVPPAGLVGNWERELRVLFRLRFRPLSSADVQNGNPFADPANSLAIISVDTLWRDQVREAYLAAPPYDLVIFDEAHKLSAWRESDLTMNKTRRYEMAEQIAQQGRHLLLMTATPHMGKDEPYYFLWRLLDPELFSTPEAFARLSKAQKRQYLLRRMKEEMVRFDGSPIFPPRDSQTIDYPLTQGPGQEQDLYDQVTVYCQTQYDRARLRNRSAAGLAMSILQRRLASSTWAMFRSLERRADKLQRMLQDLESGLLSREEWEAQQARLPTQDVRDAKTGDEEESEGGAEESERQDEDASGATAAHTVEELRAELAEVQRLVRLARQVYDRKQESKFERLWQALEDHSDTKVLIFTEFRDTLDFLVGRLEAKGLTGRLAQIHGGMDYQERDRQAELFRSPGVRIMLATDAAGEGRNLQFCWLLINYDIPWNPARLEQRMGRVHRYRQTHDVLLLNLVSKDTREGRVLKVLLDKMESIRRELGNDKVFDIIGRQFSGKPLTELIFEAVVEGKESQAQEEIERALERSQVQARLDDLERKVEVSQVRALLRALRTRRELAEVQRMMPAYVRRTFQFAAPMAGVGIRGPIDETFYLDPCPVSVARALAQYPEEIRSSLTFDRERAMPDLAQDPQAVYLHPGEPVFETVMDLFLGQYEHEGMRGATFYDADTQEPYLFCLARSQVLRDAGRAAGRAAGRELGHDDEHPQAEVLEEQMVGVRRYADGRLERAPAHLLMTLYPVDPANKPVFSDKTGLLTQSRDTTAVEAFLVEALAFPALQACRQREEAQLPERLKQVRVSYNLYQAELLRQRRLLREAAERGVPAARSKLRACEAGLESLDQRQREAEAALCAAVDALRLGPVSLYAQALVLPLPKEEVERRRDAEAEKVALAEVIRREEAEGSTIEDVSDPHLKAGFDLKVLRADGSLRYVEVKGRSGTQAVEMTANEWAQAANHRDRYWLYVAYHCEAVPELYQVPDPFGRLLARQTGAVRIQASEVLNAAV